MSQLFILLFISPSCILLSFLFSFNSLLFFIFFYHLLVDSAGGSSAAAAKIKYCLVCVILASLRNLFNSIPAFILSLDSHWLYRHDHLSIVYLLLFFLFNISDNFWPLLPLYDIINSLFVWWNLRGGDILKSALLLRLRWRWDFFLISLFLRYWRPH